VKITSRRATSGDPKNVVDARGANSGSIFPRILLGASATAVITLAAGTRGSESFRSKFQDSAPSLYWVASKVGIAPTSVPPPLVPEIDTDDGEMLPGEAMDSFSLAAATRVPEATVEPVALGDECTVAASEDADAASKKESVTDLMDLETSTGKQPLDISKTVDGSASPSTPIADVLHDSSSDVAGDGNLALLEEEPAVELNQEADSKAEVAKAATLEKIEVIIAEYEEAKDTTAKLADEKEATEIEDMTAKPYAGEATALETDMRAEPDAKDNTDTETDVVSAEDLAENTGITTAQVIEPVTDLPAQVIEPVTDLLAQMSGGEIVAQNR